MSTPASEFIEDRIEIAKAIGELEINGQHQYDEGLVTDSNIGIIIELLNQQKIKLVSLSICHFQDINEKLCLDACAFLVDNTTEFICFDDLGLSEHTKCLIRIFVEENCSETVQLSML